MNLSIRVATEVDAGRIGNLCDQLGYETSEEDIKLRIKNISLEPNSAVYVADTDGVVVGWLQVEIRQILESGEFAEITGLVVDKDYRRKGIAASLVSQAEEWAKMKGEEEIRVRTNLLRLESLPFYRSLGFGETKRQVVFLKGLKKRGSPP